MFKVQCSISNKKKFAEKYALSNAEIYTEDPQDCKPARYHPKLAMQKISILLLKIVVLVFQNHANKC
jgi:hypothetical protein